MSLESYLAFLLIAFVATATPGPAVLLAITNGVRYGMKRTTVAILGNVTGIVSLAALSALGLSAVLHASEIAFTAIKWGGGLYLIYLGINMWRNHASSLELGGDGMVYAQVPLWKLYGQAFLVAVSNPKAIAFCTALFPQFIDPSQPMLGQFSLLAGSFGFLSFFFLMFYASLAHRSRHWFANSHAVSWFNRVTGGIFMGLGAALTAAER